MRVGQCCALCVFFTFQRLCPQAIEDTVKVVVDKRYDQNADTGFFENIYKQVFPRTPA